MQCFWNVNTEIWYYVRTILRYNLKALKLGFEIFYFFIFFWNWFKLKRLNLVKLCMLYLMLFCDIGYQTLGLSKRMNCRKRRKKPKTPIKKNKKIEKYSFIFAVFLDMSFNALAHYGNADQAFCCPYRAFIKTAYIVNRC